VKDAWWKELVLYCTIAIASGLIAALVVR